MSGERRVSLAWIIAVFLIVGCEPKRLDLFPDAGEPAADTGAPDTGVPDSGEPDTGPADTGIPDADPPDTGSEPADAGMDSGMDTGPMDTGMPDTGPEEDATVPPPPPVWTVLVYMAADNNLEKFAIDDLNEMLSANISDDVQLIVQIDRASGFYELGIGGVASWESMKRFRVRKNNLQELADLGERDTGKPETLVDFIQWGFQNYPSQRRMVVLWNHGNAWQGYGGDESSGLDKLDQAELQAAFADALSGDSKKLDMIGFDACLMSTFVAAGAFKAHTDYFIASEELEPGHGWDYQAILNDLSANPNRAIPALGEVIVDAFYAQARSERKHNDITINMLDLTKYDAVQSAFDAFVTALDSQLDTQKTNVAKARKKVVGYGEHADPARDYHMVDLGDFAKQLALVEPAFGTTRDGLLTALDAMVIASRYGRTKAASTGASIYFPTASSFYKNGYDAIQEGIAWRELLKELYALADNASTTPPTFVGQEAPSSDPGSLSTDPIDPAGATAACDPDQGPLASGDVNPSDLEKIASATLVSGLVDSATGEVHVFSREPAEIDEGTGEVTGAWDRHVLVANQGAKQQIVFAEIDFTDEARFIVANIPVLYSEPQTCPCAAPGSAGYSDVDNDGEPDCADGDVDADGVADKGSAPLDNCPWVPNADQADTDDDDIGDACEGGSQAPMLACNPEPSGEYAELKAAFWRVTVDRLNGERYGATLYVANDAGVSEVSPLPGALLWPRSLIVDGTGSLVWKTLPPMPFNLQKPIDFRYVDIEQLYVLNEAGDPRLDSSLEPIRLTQELGWNDVYMRVFVSDFADRGGAAELRGDFSDCDPPALEFCEAPLIPDCDGMCIHPNALLPNGVCDDGSDSGPNLNCELRNFDDGECERPDCEAGYVRDCEGKCTLRESNLGDGTCDDLAKCESLEWDQGDCPCGPDCSGHGTCSSNVCQCDSGYGGQYCETPPSCGSGGCVLEDGENCQTCPADCGACPTLCGDGTCSAKDGENCDTCASDCGACECGDGHCRAETESCSSCSADCGACPTCGDFVCEPHTATSPFGANLGEHCGNCPTDCGACQGDCCVASDEQASGYVGGGCADPDISSCVCALDPSCCSSGWSGACHELAMSSCGLSCPACPSTRGGDQDADGICGAEDNCPLLANAQQDDEDSDGTGDACDTCPIGSDRLDPDRDGIASACDNCASVSNPQQSDGDDDGLGDACDNCPADSNSENTDGDQDGIGDACDNCPQTPSPNRTDTDGDGRGDACDPCNDPMNTPDSDGDLIQDSCDPDDDNDTVEDGTDNCPFDPNTDQLNTDSQNDGGDACDLDDDDDTYDDASDNCPLVANPDQSDIDLDQEGDACDLDDDNDLAPDAVDNCPMIPNPGQENADGVPDGGDACDIDDDDDSVLDGEDVCPTVSDPDQWNTDGTPDGGDECDTDDDNDSFDDGSDNCPLIHNSEQVNTDGAPDGGDECDTDDDNDSFDDELDNCPLLANPDQLDADGDFVGDACDPEVFAHCTELAEMQPGAMSGDYWIDPDGPLFGAPPFLASCDMETDGGGWTLVLNYLHAAGTSPALQVRANELPLLGGSGLGPSEDGTPFWGHAGNSLVDRLQPTELRFEGRTSAHSRVIHFSTEGPCVAYARSGEGSCGTLVEDFVSLDGHTSTLPSSMTDAMGNMNDLALTEFTFAADVVAFWNIRGAGNRWEVDDVATDEHATLHRVWVRSAGPPPQPLSCAHLHAIDPQLPSGVYMIDPDGPGSNEPIQAECDMVTEGGGWTLVLNYMHQGMTDPPLTVRSSDLPIIGSSSLGVDEFGTPFWGHADPAMVDSLTPSEFRFEAKTDAHPRIIHFRTDEPGCVSYLRTGVGTCLNLLNSAWGLPDHNAFLPGSLDSADSNRGDSAMVLHTFYTSGAYHWNIKEGIRWEVDDFHQSADFHTMHRVWAR